MPAVYRRVRYAVIVWSILAPNPAGLRESPFQTGFSLTDEGIQKSTDGKLKHSGKFP